MKSAFDKDIFIPPSKVKEALTSSVPRPKFADNFRGCDWIQEVSVTIRKMKRTQIPKERYSHLVICVWFLLLHNYIYFLILSFSFL